MTSKDEITTCLEELKKQYVPFKKEYNLPDFTDLNKQFDIEEIDIETDFLLRKIRRIIAEKIAGYLRFIEVILNPNNTPLFLFKLIKKLDSEDREKLTKLYEKLGSFEIELVSLDLDYDEKKEAKFIIKCYEMFNNDVKKDLSILISKMNNKDDNSKKVNGDYFG
ncbi:MAG: hypothetical protein ABIH37_05880 [archaeon]